jgi:hypothetical protein
VDLCDPFSPECVRNPLIALVRIAEVVNALTSGELSLLPFKRVPELLSEE